MKGLAMGLAALLMAGPEEGSPLSPEQLAGYEVREATRDKTRAEIDEMVWEASEKVDELRVELRLSEAFLRELRNARESSEVGQPVQGDEGALRKREGGEVGAGIGTPRREFGVPSLQGGKKLFRNIGVGRPPEVTKPDQEQGLTDIERKLDLILKELEVLKAR